MNSAYIDSIIKVVLELNATERNIRKIVLRPITISSVTKDNRRIYNVENYLSDYVCRYHPQIVETWVASDLLLFTAFDGYLVGKYGLDEGASFRNHYNNLTNNNDIEFIQRDCYRIMKLIRNAAQHNISNIAKGDYGYDIEYNHCGTDFKLKISNQGLDLLYTIVINIIQENIMGLYKGFYTEGYFGGVIRKQYKDLLDEIADFADDCGSRYAPDLSGTKLEYTVRYPVKNPVLISKNVHNIIFEYIYNKAYIDCDGEMKYYSTDYVYEGYMLPQEIGNIKNNYNCAGVDAIEFSLESMCDEWKINAL